MKSVKYFINLADGRFSVSIDKTLSDLLALKMGFEPNIPEAKKAISEELNSYVRDKKRGKDRLRAYLQKEIILSLIPEDLNEKWMVHFVDPE